MEGISESQPPASPEGRNKSPLRPSLVVEPRHRVNFKDDVGSGGEGVSTSSNAPLIPEEEVVDGNPGDLAAEILMQSIQPLVAAPVVLCRRRFGILAMFAALGFMQCAVWNTWGPISTTVSMAYPTFTPYGVAMLALWGPITCIFGTFFCTLLIQKKGMRSAMICSTLLVAVASIIRCFSQDPVYFLVTAHASSILNGLAGVVVGVAPGLISTLWFPISFRTTATGIGCTFNQLGNAGGFFLGPYMVQSPDTALLQHHRAVQAVNLRLEELLVYHKSPHKPKKTRFNDDLINTPPGLFNHPRRPPVSHPNRFIVDASPSSHSEHGHQFSSAEFAKLVDQFVVKHNISVAELIRVEELSLWNSMVAVSGDRENSFFIVTHPHPEGNCEECAVDTITVSRNESVTPQATVLLRNSIKNYMFIMAGLCVGLFVIILAFFEDQPPSPPIAVLQVPNTTFGQSGGLRQYMASSGRLRSSIRRPDNRRPTGRSSTWTGSMRASYRQEQPLGFERDSVHLRPSDLDARLISASISPPVGSGVQCRTTGEILALCFATVKDFSFALMLLAYSITLGVNVAWSSVLELNLSPLGVSQYSAGWIGTAITFGGVVLALAMTRISDCLFGHLKLSIMSLMLASTLCFLWFLLLANGCITYSFWQLVLSSSLAGSLNYAVSPLFFELAMEIGYPTPEDALGCIMTLSWNMVAILFLGSMQGITNDDSSPDSILWMNYLLVAQGVVVILLMFFVKEEYKRSGPIKDGLLGALTSPLPEQEGDGYNVSDDSDHEEPSLPARRRLDDVALDIEEEAQPVDVPDDVRLLAESSSDDGAKEGSQGKVSL